MPIYWAIVIIALWIAVITMAVVFLGALKQVNLSIQSVDPAGTRRHSSHDHGPAVGSKIPTFSAIDSNGFVVSDSTICRGAGIILILHASCGPCQQIAEQLRMSDITALARLLTIITDNDEGTSLDLPEGPRVVWQSSDNISDALGVRGTPFAIAIDQAGVVRASGVPHSVTDLTSMAFAMSAEIQLQSGAATMDSAGAL